MTKINHRLIGLIVALAVILSACAGPAGPAGPAGELGPAGPAGPVGEAAQLTCNECHNDTDLIPAMSTAWETSLHGSGTTTAYAGGRAIPGVGGCNACHSGGGFSERIASGTHFADIQTANPNASRIDCRACHQVHKTYTADDWALETTEDVKLDTVDVTFTGGSGNLCANCHQPMSAFPAATDGLVKVSSTHWGAHHGPVATMILGVGGGSGLVGEPSPHSTKLPDSCVSCHMGEGKLHSFKPVVTACVDCHADAKNFDVNGVQTEIKEKLEAVKTALQAKGLLNAEGVIVVGDYPEAQAAALWNYLMVEEDKSLGVHNGVYANSLLDAALEGLK